MPHLYAVPPAESNSLARVCDCVAHLYGNAADHGDRVRRYPSDLTDAEWVQIRDALPVPAWLNGRGGRPEEYCHRQILDAIRYLVDNGIKWRSMPVDFPPWDRVYAFHRRWVRAGFVAEFHGRLRERVRVSEGRGAEPTAAIADSQSVRGAATVAAGSRGYDGGKKTNGRKRHLVVDTIGLVLMVLVTPADVTDRDAACGMLPHLRQRFRPVRLVWADSGYTGRLVEWARHSLGVTLEIIRRTDSLAGFRVVPRRWVVERTFSWSMRSRRLVRDYEREPGTSEAIVLWSMTMLMSRRLARQKTGGRTADAAVSPARAVA